MNSQLSMPQRMSHNVWRLGCHHVPVYLLHGSGCSALFEVGISATAPLILAQLKDLEVPYEEMRYLILSHAHPDHATGLSELLAALPSARLVLSEDSRRLLSKPDIARAFAIEDTFISREVRRREPFNGVALVSEHSLIVPEDRLLVVGPGDRIDLGDVTIDLLAAMGHAVGGLLAHLPEEGVVLASDSAGYSTAAGPGFPMFFVSYSAYQDTLSQLAALAPAVLGLGHQHWFQGKDAAEYLARTARLLVDERETIRQGDAEGRTPAVLASELYARYYHNELTMFPTVSALRGCELLVRRSLEN
jgi:glyoxylase-like metal-dependent hydrolase (beta-lactamase superfamily II)